MCSQIGASHLNLSEKNQAFAHQTAVQAEPMHEKQRQVEDLLQNLASGLCQHTYVNAAESQLQFP